MDPLLESRRPNRLGEAARRLEGDEGLPILSIEPKSATSKGLRGALPGPKEFAVEICLGAA